MNVTVFDRLQKKAELFAAGQLRIACNRRFKIGNQLCPDKLRRALRIAAVKAARPASLPSSCHQFASGEFQIAAH